MNKKYQWIIIAIISLSLLLGISIAFRNQTAIIRFFATDDAFYYFQVARNIAEGKGITFDGIARGNGYHPLWMLICIPVFAFARFDLWLPLRILIVIQAILHAGTGYFVFRLLLKKVSYPLSLLTAVIWLFSPGVFQRSGSMGLETGINLFCIVLLLYYISTWVDKKVEEITWKQLFLTGVFAGFALLARLDNIYLLTFLGAWLALKQSGLSQRWFFIDFLVIAIGVMFGNFKQFGMTADYYAAMPSIKLFVVTSMLTYPLGQFLMGVYHLQEKVQSRRSLLPKILVGGIIGASIEFALITLVLAKGDNYLQAFLIQNLIFLAGTVAGKMILFPAKGVVFGKMATPPRLFLDFGALIRLNWSGLIKVGIAYFAPLFGGLSAFLAFNHFYFGTAMPLSGKIKEWWGGLETVYGSAPTLLMPFLGFHEKGPWYIISEVLRPISGQFQIKGISGDNTLLWLVGIIIVALLVFYFKSEKMQQKIAFFSFEPITLGILFHACYYTMTGYVGYRGWYWTIERFYLLILIVLVLEVLGEILVEQFPKLIQNWMGWELSGTAIVLIVSSFVRFNVLFYPFTLNEETVYLHNTRMLEQCTPPGSLIAMTGGGVEGYFVEDRILVNMDGLINGVEYYGYLIDMRLDDYMVKIDLDYVFGKQNMLLASEPYREPLKDRLVEFDPPNCEYHDSMVLYEFVSEE